MCIHRPFSYQFQKWFKFKPWLDDLVHVLWKIILYKGTGVVFRRLTGGPGSPLLPFSPFSPGSPGYPCSPCAPAEPLKPRSPFSPLTFNVQTNRKYMAITKFMLKFILSFRAKPTYGFRFIILKQKRNVT